MTRVGADSLAIDVSNAEVSGTGLPFAAASATHPWWSYRQYRWRRARLESEPPRARCSPAARRVRRDPTGAAGGAPLPRAVTPASSAMSRAWTRAW